jgi:vacuolar-type H+-ATPase subunit F/Vma7
MRTVLVTERTDASIGLRLAGIETSCVKSAEAAAAELEKVRSDANTGVLLITPGIEKLCPDIVGEIRVSGRPLLVLVPDSDRGLGDSNAISEYIQNAIGIKLD